MSENVVYLQLGSNLGDRENILINSKGKIEEYIGRIEKESSIYETASWGIEDQPLFLNQILVVKTSLDYCKIFFYIKKIEEKLGRTREKKWASRLIDIDIIFFNQEIIESPEVSIPHKQIASRRFVLEPLAEVAPGFMHPVHNKTVFELLNNCSDNLSVKKLESNLLQKLDS